jgi:antitoxin component of MazEF toxin-antitoxin module
MVRLRVRRIGKSLGLTLPAEMTRALNVREGDPIYLVKGPDGSFRITPYDPDFSDAMETAGSFMARFRNTLHELGK